MPIIKVIVQEALHKRVPLPAGGETYSEETYFETVHEITSADPGVIAGSLRAIADKYSPPKVAYRGTE